nr:MAG TPA: putative membrane protein [Caudoviricetes sp.]
MAKKKLQNTRMEVDVIDGTAMQTHSLISEDDNCLPAPEELKAYQAIAPGLVEHFVEVAVKEQNARHERERRELQAMVDDSRRAATTQRLGMILAFLLILTMLVLTALALWIDRPWFAGIGFFVALITTISAFIKKQE